MSGIRDKILNGFIFNSVSKKQKIKSLPTLTYKSVTELKHVSDFDDAWIKTIYAMTLNELFAYFNDLLHKAQKEKHIEEQLILYLRCEQIGLCFSHNTQFDKFAKKNDVSLQIVSCKQQIVLLAKELGDIYLALPINEKDVKRSREKPTKEAASPATKLFPDASKMLITPGEFIDLVVQQRDFPLFVMDIRSDQTRKSLALNPNCKVTVIPFPRKLIITGLSLRHSRKILPPASSKLLQKITSNSKVVIMDEKTPPLLEEKLDPKSHAGMLAFVFYNYFGIINPKAMPMCVFGGFEKFNVLYPSYVRLIRREFPIIQSNNVSPEAVFLQIPCPICFDRFPSKDGFVCAFENCRRSLCASCHDILKNDPSQTSCSFCRTEFNYTRIIIPRID